MAPRDMRRTPRRTLRQMRSSSSTLSKCRAISHACRAQCQNSSALPSATRLSFQMRRSMAIRKSRSTFSERSCAAISSNSEISCFNGSNNSSPVRPREIPSPSDAATFIYVSNRLWLSPAATWNFSLARISTLESCRVATSTAVTPFKLSSANHDRQICVRRSHGLAPSSCLPIWPSSKTNGSLPTIIRNRTRLMLYMAMWPNSG